MRLLALAASVALLGACASPSGPQPSKLGHQPQWTSPGISNPGNFCVHASAGQCRDTSWIGFAHV